MKLSKDTTCSFCIGKHREASAQGSMAIADQDQKISQVQISQSDYGDSLLCPCVGLEAYAGCYG